MSTLDEKRVYADKRARTEVYLATGTGLAVVSVVSDRVGGFSIAHRAPTRSVVCAEGRVAAATEADVVVREGAGEAEFRPTDFGPAVAVGFDEGTLLAADEGGTVSRFEDGEWADLGSVDADVRAIDGNLVATADGLYRVSSAGFSPAGLDAVNDVSTAGVPLAATETGLYKLGNGWMEVLDGEFAAVAADHASATPGRLGRAHAVSGHRLFAHADGDWTPEETADPLVDVGYGEAVYAVTGSGTFLADAGEGFRSRELGLPDVAELAVR